MTTTNSPDVSDTSLTRDLLHAARYYLGGRRGLLVLAAAALVAGLALNWSLLVAAGIAPLLLTAPPCVTMCALGLCMNRMVGRSCSIDAVPEKTSSPSAENLSTAQALEIGPDRRANGAQAVAVPATATEPPDTEERRTTDA